MLSLSTWLGHTFLVKARKPYHHSNLREALLRASIELLRDPASGNLTLREVARRAGVSHNAPYRHFRDKDDLLAAIAEEGFDRLTAAMQSASGKGQTPFKRLQNAGIAYIEFAQAEPEHFSVMFSIDLRENRHVSAKTAADQCFAELVTLVVASYQGRSFKGVSPETAALVAWTQVHGVAVLALRGQLRFRARRERAEFANLATEAIGRGLRLTE
jgi:AcrR family transcriptional regulator